MKRFFFDVRDGQGLVTDEAGALMSGIEAAEEEAAQSLLDIVGERVGVRAWHQVAIEVRDDIGPVMTVTLQLHIERQQRQTA